MAACDVDDAEALMAKSDVPVHEHPTFVGAAMAQHIPHPLEHARLY
jgi:hypothetical protein